MEWNISNKRRNVRIVVIVALISFSTVFMLTGYIMTKVYGIKPGDPGYTDYISETGQEQSPYSNFLSNGCFIKEHLVDDKTVILDTKGLEELGLPSYDPNTCLNMAQNMLGDYNINKIDKYGDNQMKITLVKK